MFFFLASVLSGLFNLPANAGQLVVERAVFEDKAGNLTIGQIRQMPFVPTAKVISKGYTRSTIWIRLTVDAGTDKRDLVLRIFPAVLDEVGIFPPAPAPAGRSSGDGEGKELDLRAGTILLPGQPGKRDYYLRIKATGSMLVMPRVETPEEFHQEASERGMLLGGMLVFCVVVTSATLLLLVMRRERLYVSFLVNFWVSVVVFFGWFGYLKQFFGLASLLSRPEVFSFLVILNILTGVFFFQEVLKQFSLPKWGQRIFLALFVLYIPVVVSFFLVDRQLALSLATLWGIGANAFFLPLTAYVFFRKKSATWYIGPMIFVAILLLIRTFLIMRGVIALDESIMSIMAFRMFAFSSCFFVALLLLDRDKNSRLQHSVLKEAVARSLAESEKDRRILQERFMTMLMHELKTPLAIIQLAAASLGRHSLPGSGDAVRIRNIARSVDDLNGLVERCVQADQVEQGAKSIRKTAFSPNELVRDLVDGMGPDRISIVASSEFRVFSDHQYLKLILQNLLSNALKYAQSGSVITLELQRAAVKGAEVVMFHVSNVVGPVGPPDPARIFVRYYRSEGARSQVGAGLGLWLAREVARQLDSDVHYELVSGRAVFSFGLALA